MTEDEKAALIAEMNTIDWWHSIELPALGVTTPGREPNPRSRDKYMRIPWDQMEGKTVLDVGAWDGLYSFEAEKHGAKVTASEVFPFPEGIVFAHSLIESSVEIFLWYVEEKCKESWREYYDFVFFFGVIYHLKNPYLALQNLFEVLKPGGLLILETALIPAFPAWTKGIDSPKEKWQQWAAIRHLEEMPLLRFCEGEEDGDQTNWNYPNRAWVEAALRSIGYVDIEFTGGAGNRAAWHARRPS